MGTHSQPVILFLFLFFLIHKSLWHFVIKFSTAQLCVLSGKPPGSAGLDSQPVLGAESLLPAASFLDVWAPVKQWMANTMRREKLSFCDRAFIPGISQAFCVTNRYLCRSQFISGFPS